MEILRVLSFARRDQLHKESACFVFFLSFVNCLYLILIGTNNFAVFYNHVHGIVLLDDLVLMGEIIFKFFIKRTSHILSDSLVALLLYAKPVPL